MKIRSYPIPIEESFELDLPEHAMLLTIREQRGQARLWAIIDQEQFQKRRRFYVVTGDKELKFDAQVCDYIGSFQAAGDLLVFHVFNERDSVV